MASKRLPWWGWERRLDGDGKWQHVVSGRDITTTWNLLNERGSLGVEHTARPAGEQPEDVCSGRKR